MSSTGLLLLSDYSDDQEDEADWLAAALLLPRDALVRGAADRRHRTKDVDLSIDLLGHKLPQDLAIVAAERTPDRLGPAPLCP